MKKLFIASFAAVLLLAGSFSLSAEAAAPDNGFYSITKGKEQYYSLKDFRMMSPTEKMGLFKQQYFIVSGPAVYPINSLLLPNSAISKTAKAIADFEKTNDVNLSEIAKGPSATSFEVLSID